MEWGLGSMAKLLKRQAARQEPRAATAAFIFTCGIVVYEPRRVGPERVLSHERARNDTSSQVSQSHGARFPNPMSQRAVSARQPECASRCLCPVVPESFLLLQLAVA